MTYALSYGRRVLRMIDSHRKAFKSGMCARRSNKPIHEYPDLPSDLVDSFNAGWQVQNCLSLQADVSLKFLNRGYQHLDVGRAQ